MLRKVLIMCCALILTQPVYSLAAQEAAPGNTHIIKMEAAKLESGQLAYRMVSHRVRSSSGLVQDITNQYSTEPTIPGPTIVMTEGDVAEVTLEHDVEGATDPVSIHVHGVHYKIDSDGTMKVFNHTSDQAAFPGKSYTYKWTAAPGTAGTWPYHDHAFGNPLLGAEDKGLYGTLIVNPKNGKVQAMIDGQYKQVDIKDIKREFILWMHETTFWGMELNHLANHQVPLWTNPTLGAREGELVRFHVIGIGTAFHTFHLHGHRWTQPGTTHLVDTVNIGPIVREAFVIKAGEGVGPGNWHYHCHVLQHMQSGMMGGFRVVEN